MPRYSYQTPRARVYAYNYGYMNNYYKPLTYYVEKDSRAPSEQPGHQSLAERLKTFPMDGSMYRTTRASSVPPMLALPAPEEKKEPKDDLAIIPAPEPTLRKEFRRSHPVWQRHPWDWDCLWIPPHETRVTPHFGLATSHDLMLKYFSLRPLRRSFLDDYVPSYTRHYLLSDFNQGIGHSLGHRLCPFHDNEVPRSIRDVSAERIGFEDIKSRESRARDLLDDIKKDLKESSSISKDVLAIESKEEVQKRSTRASSVASSLNLNESWYGRKEEAIKRESKLDSLREERSMSENPWKDELKGIVY